MDLRHCSVSCILRSFFPREQLSLLREQFFIDAIIGELFTAMKSETREKALLCGRTRAQKLISFRVIFHI